MFKVGDHVRTNAEWNARHDCIEGNVKEIKCVKYTKTRLDKNGSISFIIGEYDYTTIVVIEGAEKQIHESWYEKVL